MKILVTIPNFTPAASAVLAPLGEVVEQTPTQKTLADVLADCDVALVGLGLHLDAAALAAAKKLKVIATATTGLDHLDLAAAAARGIEVLSLRDEKEFLNSITGTAELAFGLILNLARNIIPAAASVKRYEWDREHWRGHNLQGKTLGIVGVGRLGRMMVRYGLAFGMKVLGCDPNIDITTFGATSVGFDQLIRESDIISIHVHLTPETENMFNQTVFEKMKPTAYLINTSRGKIVNEDDLLTALENKKISGYATDVLADELFFDKERIPHHSLIEYAKTHNNCLIVPHIGGMTYESRTATDLFIAQKLAGRLRPQK
ncbi:MAG: NAD(P)-dependent oxidoreductase [Patescibacteria group bacterium]